MSKAYAYIRPTDDDPALTSQAQRDAIDKAYKERCPDVPWGGYLEDPEGSLDVPLAERAAGRQLLDLLQPGDHLFMTQLSRPFTSFDEMGIYLESWLAEGVNVHVLNCPGFDSGKPIEASLVLQALELYANIKRSFRRARATERKGSRGSLNGSEGRVVIPPEPLQP